MKSEWNLFRKFICVKKKKETMETRSFSRSQGEELRNVLLGVATSFNFGPKNSEPRPRRMKIPQRRRTSCILNLERGEFISLICVTQSNWNNDPSHLPRIFFLNLTCIFGISSRWIVSYRKKRNQVICDRTKYVSKLKSLWISRD